MAVKRAVRAWRSMSKATTNAPPDGGFPYGIAIVSRRPGTLRRGGARPRPPSTPPRWHHLPSPSARKAEERGRNEDFKADSGASGGCARDGDEPRRAGRGRAHDLRPANARNRKWLRPYRRRDPPARP